MPQQSETSQLNAPVDSKGTESLSGKQTSLDLFEDPSPEELESTAQPTFADKRPLSIIVADDNEINRRVICLILDKLGYSCLEAGNGLELLTLYKKHEGIDFIFMDVDMPEMDGLEASRSIRAQEAESDNNSRLPTEIIAVTANVSDETRLACKRAGMNGYLEKPITIDMIKDQLLRSWAKIRSRRNQEAS